MTESPYQEKFSVGTVVQVARLEVLEQFHRSWKYHHPLTEKQLLFASATATVADVGYYHGGDVLYWLKDVPGVWHEQLLNEPSEANTRS